MREKGNILDFEQAKAARRSARRKPASARGESQATRSRSKAGSRDTERPGARKPKRSAGSTASSARAASSKSSRSSVKTGKRTQSQPLSKTKSQSKATSKPKSQSKSTSKATARPSTAQMRSRKDYRTQGSVARVPDERPRGSAPKVSVVRGGKSAKGRIDDARKAQLKKKADRRFDRTVKHDDAPARESSRAAVYKMSMGKNQRKSTRMQNRSSAGVATSVRAVPHIGFHLAARFAIPLVVVACMVFSALFVYPGACQYYQAVRGQQQLQAEYDALTARNDGIQATIDSLSTDAGVEARARREFGLVKPGETAVTVTGLPADTSAAGAVMEPVGEVPAPSTWYTDILDPLFGYGG